MVKEFGNRVVMPFVDQVMFTYLILQQIWDMMRREKYMIHVSGGQAQVNISNDNSTINAN